MQRIARFSLEILVSLGQISHTSVLEKTDSYNTSCLGN